jgi:CheY-like chemotaxis protein
MSQAGRSGGRCLSVEKLRPKYNGGYTSGAFEAPLKCSCAVPTRAVCMSSATTTLVLMQTIETTGKPLIAIVDDDAAVREALEGLMRALGYDAEPFACGEDFLNSPLIERTACLIADVQMPGITGVELHRRLIASGQPVPTVLITAYPDDDIRARALAAGAICYLGKPFSEDELLRCLDSAFHRG